MYTEGDNILEERGDQEILTENMDGKLGFLEVSNIMSDNLPHHSEADYILQEQLNFKEEHEILEEDNHDPTP